MKKNYMSKNDLFSCLDKLIGKDTRESFYDFKITNEGILITSFKKISFEEANNMASSWIEKIAKKGFNVRWVHADTATVCLLFSKHNRLIRTGTANFNLNGSDKESYYIGHALALSRATGEKLPDKLLDYLEIDS